MRSGRREWFANGDRSLIDATPLERRRMTRFPKYHEITAEARMTPGVVDSLGFEDLGETFGPPPRPLTRV